MGGSGVDSGGSRIARRHTSTDPTSRGPSGHRRLLAVAVVLATTLLAVTLLAGGATAASPPPNATLPPVADAPPQDPDGDGLYEDVNGDGQTNLADAGDLFQHRNDDAVRENVDAYDFSGNGEIDLADVVDLFRWTSRPPGGFEANATTVSPGQPVAVAAVGADEGSGTGPADREYEWTFGDGTRASGPTATHAYDDPGTYEVRLNVTDSDGVWNATSRTVTVRSDAVAGNDTERRVTGYYTSWARYQRDYQPADVPLSNLTHLNYAFLDVTANGTVTFGDRWADEQNLQAFQNRSANHPNTTMLLSVGGWTYSDDFSEAAATPERRARFARTAVAIMRQYGFEGIDVDWEYPGGGGKAGNTVGASDPHNFTLLVERTRTELDRAEREDGREYELTMAASGDPEKAGRLEVGAIADDLDAVNVMTYDYDGAWGERTGHNAPLYARSNDTSGGDALSVNRSMAFWANQPIDGEKVTLGLPFYGRSYAGVESGDGLDQPFTGTPSGTYGSQGLYEYWDVRRNLNASDSSYRYHWDDEAKVPYLYSPAEDVFVSYDDPRSVRAKVYYAQRHEFGGVMFWALSHDKGGVLLGAVNEELSAPANATSASG